MAILARHLLFDFPQYWNVFGRTTSYAAGKRIWTTNRLLRTYRGADGLKTGYTRAAGYSLAATAKRGRKHIVAVQLGADSSADRARRVTRLLDIGFARAPSNVRRVPPRGAPRDPIVVARSPVPPRRPGVPSTGFAAFAEALAPASAAAAPLSAESGMIEKIAPQARPARVGPQETSARQSAPAARPEPMSRSRLAPRTARLPVPKGSARDATRRSDGPIPRPRPMRLVRQGAPSRATGPGSFGANVDASARFARLFAVERSPV